MVKILFFGDVFGRTGRRMLKETLPQLREKYQPDLVLANGENAAGGAGIDPATANELLRAGAEILTSGNHIWNRREVIPLLDRLPIVRPLNFSEGTPGRGWVRRELSAGQSVVVVNLIGRIFMNDLVDCPFKAVERLMEQEKRPGEVWFVDFHAEATSEKCAMGYFLDGKASVVAGTHTHVQTADEKILPNGTAYITDVGMCGPADSIIGVKPELVVERFVRGMPARFDAVRGRGLMNAIFAEIDEQSGRAVRIERLRQEENPA